MWGAGVLPGEKREVARQVDIAPTVARILGMPGTLGIDKRGIRSYFVHLVWQDGHVLESALDGETADPGRSGHPLDALRASGVDFVEGTGLGIYLD
jgi:hypothetical protein